MFVDIRLKMWLLFGLNKHRKLSKCQTSIKQIIFMDGGCLEKKELGWYSAAEVDAATAFKKSLSSP